MRTCQSFLLCGVVLSVSVSTAVADDWPQWLGPRRDSVWRESGILETFPAGGPRVKWRVPIDGGYAGPAVAEGRVYVTDYVTDGDRLTNPNNRARLQGSERVLCFDAADGKLLWKHTYPCAYDLAYPAGPRCTPALAHGKVYTLGAEGHLFCLDAVRGTVLWRHDFKKEYKVETPRWGFAAHPLIDGPRLICLVGGPGSVAVAFDRDTGKEVWRALSAREIGYCPPTLIEAGGTRQLLIWHAEALNSLNPENGKVYWSVPLEPNYGMAIAAPRQLGASLFAGGVGNRSVLLKLAADRPAAEVVWRGKPLTSVYPVNSTPFLEAGTLYGVDTKGALRAVKLETGQRLWATLAPTTGGDPGLAGTAFLVKQGSRFFLFSETGHLIIARLSPKGYDEIGRARILEPVGKAFDRRVVWSHPAFARRCVFARNDRELVCVSLAAEVKPNK